jgi:hypothetical protein
LIGARMLMVLLVTVVYIWPIFELVFYVPPSNGCIPEM